MKLFKLLIVVNLVSLVPEFKPDWLSDKKCTLGVVVDTSYCWLSLVKSWMASNFLQLNDVTSRL